MKMLYKRYAGTSLVLYFIYMFSRRVAADIPDDIDSHIQFLQDLKGARGLDALRETISSLDDDLANYKKRTCQFGLNSHHCALSALDQVMNANDWLSSDQSPGKRSQPVTDPQLVHKYSRILEEINRKREHLAVLKEILDGAEAQVTYKRKRSCRFNLGGRCATELASAIADQYYYLNGPDSPGRRKRRSNNLQK